MHAPLRTKIEQLFKLTLNHNQSQEINRLCYEIRCRDSLSDNNIMDILRHNNSIKNTAAQNKFQAIKQQLIRLRFPVTSGHHPIAANQLFLPPLRPALAGDIRPPVPFLPKHIFFAPAGRNSTLARRFHQLFPHIPQKEIASLKTYLREHPFQLSRLKDPVAFLLREHWDFIKPCPCTQGHIGCNYWIFNLGFGCPYDCSYCFLQQYTNTPGILLPSNLDDFFDRFNTFIKQFSRPIRIGTGEFCDSLALDHITGYSVPLIDFFRGKPVLFELKTKSDNIANLLTCSPSANIIISWSLNPQTIIDQEEFGAVCLLSRLQAATAVQKHGYRLAFHFDPIIYYPGWEDAYAEVVRQLYQHVKPPLRWISLGTLRGTRLLKTIAEQRFPQSRIWYGELLLGKDKKLRYPQFLRKDMYQRMHRLIRAHDPHTPIYLCMEDPDCWQAIHSARMTSSAVEKILTRND